MREKTTASTATTGATSDPVSRFRELVDVVVGETGEDRRRAIQISARRAPDLYVAARKQRDEEQERERRGAAWRNAAGRLADATIEGWELHGDPAARDRQRRVLDRLAALNVPALLEGGQNILFVGPAGSGKDHLMHALARQVYAPGAVRMVNGSALRRELRAAAMSDEGEGGLIDRLSRTRLLCLSDPAPTAGAEVTTFQADALYQIVNARWNACRATWATVNLPVRDLRAEAERILTAPVWDRLKDGAIVVKCDWASYRKHAEVIE